jgi:hypothetical protein
MSGETTYVYFCPLCGSARVYHFPLVERDENDDMHVIGVEHECQDCGWCEAVVFDEDEQ